MRLDRFDSPDSANTDAGPSPRLTSVGRRRGLTYLARLVPSLIAVYELRYLMGHLTRLLAAVVATDHAGFGSVRLWAMVVLVAAAGSMLFQTGRGLSEHVLRPRWSASSVARWLLCCAVLVALVRSQGVLSSLLSTGHRVPRTAPPGAGGWSSIPAALSIGLVLAASLGGARWLLDRVTGCQPWRVAAASRREAARLSVVSAVLAPASAPLLAGWSGRGPPAAASASA